MTDFVASLKDDRLFRQAKALNEVCGRPLLIVEGEDAFAALGLPPEALRGVLLALLVGYRIPLLRTVSVDETALTIARVAAQERRRLGPGPRRPRSPRGGRFRSSPRSPAWATTARGASSRRSDRSERWRRRRRRTWPRSRGSAPPPRRRSTGRAVRQGLPPAVRRPRIRMTKAPRFRPQAMRSPEESASP